MRRQLLGLPLAVSAVALATLWAAPAGAQDTAARAAVDASNRKFGAAVAKGDAAALAALYAPDATVMPPNSEPVKGRESIQGMWKGLLGTGVTALDLSTVSLDTQGNLASEVGTYVLKVKDGAVADRGKYVVVWKKHGGQWLMQTDIWNSSQPAPQP